MTSEDMDNQAVINIESQNHMTKLFLPKFISNKKGLIISLSSLSSYFHTPYLSGNFFLPLFLWISLPFTFFFLVFEKLVYASTKAYNRKLSEELWLENYGTGVEFLAVCPGLYILVFVLKCDEINFFFSGFN